MGNRWGSNMGISIHILFILCRFQASPINQIHFTKVNEKSSGQTSFDKSQIRSKNQLCCRFYELYMKNKIKGCRLNLNIAFVLLNFIIGFVVTKVICGRKFYRSWLPGDDKLIILWSICLRLMTYIFET